MASLRHACVGAGARQCPGAFALRTSVLRARGRINVSIRCALFKQVIRDSDTLSKTAGKYGLAVTELKDIDIVNTVVEVQQAAKARNTKPKKQQGAAITAEVTATPVHTAAARFAPSWLLPGLLGVGGAAALGVAAIKVFAVGQSPGGAAALPAAAATGALPTRAVPVGTAGARPKVSSAAFTPAAALAAAGPASAPPRASAASASAAGSNATRTAVKLGPTPSKPITVPPAAAVQSTAPAVKQAKTTAAAMPSQRPATPKLTAASRAATPAAVAARAASPLPQLQASGNSAAGAAALAAAEAAMQAEAASRASAADDLLQPLGDRAGALLDKMAGVFAALDPQAPAKAAVAKAAASAAALASAKASTLDLLYGAGRGLGATPEQRAGVEEALMALEAMSPSRHPTAALAALGGTWKLLYTTHTPTLLVLNALRSLPLVDLGEVYQVIDPDNMTAHNQVDVALPFLVSLTARTPLAPTTPSSRQLRVRFTHVGVNTHIHTPSLTAALAVPEEVTVLGAKLDLRPLQRLLVQVNAGAASAQQVVDGWLSPAFPVGDAAADSSTLWLLTTYLDDTLRISRDAGGRVFVMLKDVRLPEEVQEEVPEAIPAAVA